jgi:hypothetical protein
VHIISATAQCPSSCGNCSFDDETLERDAAHEERLAQHAPEQTPVLTEAQRGPARAPVMPRLTQAAAHKETGQPSEFDDQRRRFPTQALIIVN